MTSLRSLVIKDGNQQLIRDADNLLVGTGIDASTAGPLSIGTATATGITIGAAAVTTAFPGPVTLQGDVTTVGGTTFTTDATFEGNVTFGNGPSDTVTFAATTTVIGNIAFNGAGYKITNLLDPTAGSQEAATAAWVEAQIAAIPATVPGAPANSIQFNDGDGGFGGSANLTWSGTDLDVTGAVNILGGDPRALTIQDVTATTDILFYDAAVEELTIQSSVSTAVTTIGAGQNNISDTGHTAQLSVVPASSVALDFVIPVASSVVPSIIAKDGAAAAAPLKLDASEIDVNSVKIVNVADGVNPNDAVNFSQLSAIVSGVSDVTATAPLLSSGGPTPDISIDTAGASNGDVLTFNAGAWAAAAPADVNVGSTFVAVGDGSGIVGSNALTFNAVGELGISATEPVLSVSRSDVGNAVAIIRPESVEFSVPAAVAAFALLKASDAVSPIPLKLDASELDVDSVKIVNVSDGVDPNDAVNKSQLDAIDVNVGDTFVAVGDGSGITGSANLTYILGTSTLGSAAALNIEAAADSTWNVTGANLTISTTGGGSGRDVTIQSGNEVYINAGGVGDAVVINSGYNPTNFAVRGSSFGGQPLLYVDGQTSQNVGIGTNAPVTALSLASGQFSIPDGTAAAPSIALGTNLDTGFFKGTTGGSTVVTNEALSVSLNNNEAVGFRDLSLGGVTGTQLFVGVSAAGSSTNTIGLLTLGQRTTGGEALSPYSAMIEAHIDDTVTGSGVGAGLYTYGSASSGSVSSGFLAKKARGSQASPAVVQSGDVLGQFVGQGYDGNATGGFTANASSAKMQVVAAENFVNGTNNGALLDLYTVPAGSTTTTARLRVGASGNVGIGAFAGATDPANLFSVADKFGVDSNGRVVEYDDAAVTKGDLLAGSAASGYVAVGVGTNGQVLQADSSAAAGVSWQTPTVGTVTGVTASAPLASSGGVTPDISLTGIIDVANGGTGAATLAANAVVLGNGTSAVQTVAPSTSGNVLTSNGTTWQSTALPAQTDYSTVALNTATNSVAQGDACYVSAAGTVNEAIADGTDVKTARVAGIASATSNRVSVLGIIEDCNFEGSLSLAVGDSVFLSATSAGKLTNVSPSAGPSVVAEIGIITTVNAAGGGAAAADVLWQPKSIIIL